jgi:hypothetical protein
VGLGVAGATRPDLKLVTDPLARLVGKRPRPPKKRPQGRCLDKGDDYAEVRDALKEFRFTAPLRANGIKLSQHAFPVLGKAKAMGGGAFVAREPPPTPLMRRRSL